MSRTSISIGIGSRRRSRRMAEWLSPARLNYACSALLLDHVEQVNLSSEQWSLPRRNSRSDVPRHSAGLHGQPAVSAGLLGERARGRSLRWSGSSSCATCASS